MNHTQAVNVWKGTNRVSQLWEDLLTNCVPPNPPAGEAHLPVLNSEDCLPKETDSVSLNAMGRQSIAAEPGLIERAGFESLRLIRTALETLTAPVETEPAVDPSWEKDSQDLIPAGKTDLEDAAIYNPILATSALGLTFIKVSREPEPQPGSTIETRRIAYGLKVPLRPLHKRPIYQRVLFCLRHTFGRRKETPAIH